MKQGKDKQTDHRYRNNKYPAVYASMYPKMCEVAEQFGYAIAIHGSLRHDFDIIAVPWAEDADSNENLVAGMISAFDGQFVHEVGNVGIKPHGRRVWTIFLDGHAYIDFGVMPLHAATQGSDE